MSAVQGFMDVMSVCHIMDLVLMWFKCLILAQSIIASHFASGAIMSVQLTLQQQQQQINDLIHAMTALKWSLVELRTSVDQMTSKLDQHAKVMAWAEYEMDKLKTPPRRPTGGIQSPSPATGTPPDMLSKLEPPASYYDSSDEQF